MERRKSSLKLSKSVKSLVLGSGITLAAIREGGDTLLNAKVVDECQKWGILC